MKKLKCPTCKSERVGTISSNKSFPFCCGKCKDVDLYNWLVGEYTYMEEGDLPIKLVTAEEDN